MLPSKGYFQSLNCPFYESGFCNRPHCHFRHCKRDKSADDNSQLDESGDEDEQDLEGHLSEGFGNILSNVDIEENSLEEKSLKDTKWMSQQSAGMSISYKPTPISELRKRHIPITTAPSVTHSNRRRIEYDIKVVRKPKVEYVPESLNNNQSLNEGNSRLEITNYTETSYSSDLKDTVYKATKISSTYPEHGVGNTEFDNETFQHRTGFEENPFNQSNEDSEDEIDFDQVSSELNFLDEILKEYEKKPESKVPSDKSLLNVGPDVDNDGNVKSKKEVKSFTDSISVKKEVLNGFDHHQKNLLNKEDNLFTKVNENGCNDDKVDTEFGSKCKSIHDSKKMLSTNSIVDKQIKCDKDKDLSYKPNSQKKNDHKSTSSDHKRKSSENHKSENHKSKKKSPDPSISSSDKKIIKQESDGKSSMKKYDKIELDTMSSKVKLLKREHSSSSNKSSKKMSEHKSERRKESEHRSNSHKSLKKDSDHKSDSIKKSDHRSRSANLSNREAEDELISTKKRRHSSPENHTILNKNKEESRYKPKLNENTSSGNDGRSSKAKEEVKHRRESSDKKERRSSSSRNDEKKKRDHDKKDIEKNMDTKRRRSGTRQSVDDDDDEIEIISNPETVIIIDSEEETIPKESNSKRDLKNKRTQNSPSPHRNSSPMFPSDDSLSDVIEERTNEDNIRRSMPATSSRALDDPSLLDHRVKSNIKNRVSLGNIWRPPAKKQVELMTPASRLLMFRKKKELEEKESLDGTANIAGRVKIGCVPNVRLLLEEKERLLLGVPRKRVSLQKPGISKAPAANVLEDKDEPPKATSKIHPLKNGADIDTRQRCLDLLYKVERQLVPPNRSYRSAQVKCLQVEEEIWTKTKKDTYFKAMKDLVDKQCEKISMFSLQNWFSIKPRRSVLFPPELIPKTRPGPAGDAGSERVSIYSALQKYILTDEQLESECYPRKKFDPVRNDLAYINPEGLNQYRKTKLPIPARGELVCSKCLKCYMVDENGRSFDQCNYHKKNRTFNKQGENIYVCCHKTAREPCMHSEHHSTDNIDYQNLEGFLETREPSGEMPEEGWGVFGVDCEMYFSTGGVELGRVTVVNPELRVVYDTCVRPDKPVTDYCTVMSGLTEENLSNAPSTFAEVQEVLLELFNSKTILIGHSLENDLKVLKLVHNTVVDTAIVYKSILNKKVALKQVALEQLNETIQNEEDGHDSSEDAITCVKLMRLKLFNEATKKGKSKAPTIRGRFPSRKNADLN